MTRWNTSRKRPTAAEYRTAVKAAALEQCQLGKHTMTHTFRPSERLCTTCGLITYCPQCLQQHHLLPVQSKHAYAQECAAHRNVEVLR